MNKRNFLAISFLLGGVALSSCSGGDVDKVGKIRCQRDSVSYSIGLQVGEQFGMSINQFPGDVVISKNVIWDGYEAQMKGKSVLKIETADSIFGAYFMKVRAMASDSTAFADTSKVRATGSMANLADTLSYMFGMNLAKNAVEAYKNTIPAEIGFDENYFSAGFKDALFGDSTLLTVPEAQAVLQNMQEDMQKLEAKKTSEMIQKNTEWLKDFAAKHPEYKTTASGILYKEITTGKGAMPVDTSVVKVHYAGKLTDGTKFDSSYDRGEPAVFPLQGVISGWTEILKLMPVGSKWEVYIPSQLAYGSRAVGNIPANSILNFEIELLEIVTSQGE